MRKLFIAVLTLAFLASPAFLPATGFLASSAQAKTTTTMAKHKMTKHKMAKHKTAKHKMAKHKMPKKPMSKTDKK